MYTKGDIIGFSRKYWSHYGIYVGDDMILHLDLNDHGMGVVCKQKINEIEGVHWLANHRFVKQTIPYEQTVAMGNSMIGPYPTYNLFTDNCEHFVNRLRCGYNFSLQTIALVLATGFCLQFLISRCNFAIHN